MPGSMSQEPERDSALSSFGLLAQGSLAEVAVVAEAAVIFSASFLMRLWLSRGFSSAVFVSSPEVSLPMLTQARGGCTLRPMESACRQAAPTSRWLPRKNILIRLMTSRHDRSGVPHTPDRGNLVVSAQPRSFP